MIPKEWLYFILEPDGRSQYEDAQNNVSSTVHPTCLKEAPMQSGDIAMGMSRDKKAWGLVRSFSFPLTFVRDGMRILAHNLYKSGIETITYLLITQRTVQYDPSWIKDYHTMWYRGQIDYSSVTHEENGLTVQVTQGGLARQLKANENTKYEFDLSDTRASDVYFDGLPFNNTANFSGAENYDYDDSIYTHRHIAAFGFTSSDGDAPGAAFFVQDNENEGSIASTFYKTSTNYHLRVDTSSTAPIVFHYKGKLVVSCNLNRISASGIRFELWSSRGTLVYQFPGAVPAVPGTNATINIDYTTTVAQGEKLFLVGVVYGNIPTGAIGFKYSFLDGSDVVVTYKNKFAPSTVRCFSAPVILDMIIERICGYAGRTSSTLLTQYAGIMLTSGDGLRGLQGAKLKLSFNDLMEILRVNLMAGWSIENENLVVESLETFLNPLTAAMELSDASELKVSPAKELLCNTIRIGHKDKAINSVNGKYSFNNTITYLQKDTTTQSQELTLISPAVACAYAIEYTRANFEGKTTTDSETDNEIFLVNAEHSAGGGWKLKRRTYNSITGIPDGDQCFNIEDITPARLMKRWSQYINSLFYKMNGRKLEWQTTEKNDQLVTDGTDGVIAEKADITITDKILFKPFMFSLVTPIPVGLYALWNTTPNTPFSFLWNNYNYGGFLWTGGFSPDDNKQQPFQLLCMPQTDLTKLEIQ